MQQTRPQRGGKPRQFSRGSRSGGGGRPRSGSNRGPRTKQIASHRFVNRAVERAPEAVYEPKHAFADFALNDRIKSTLEHLGFTVPSAIQDQAIPLVLEGKDVIGLANTGTGKTAAFLLPIIEKLSHRPTRNSVLILSPTRELAQQIDAEFKRFAAGQKMYSAVCVGGANIGRQIRDLQRNPHVIIATPGRLKDLLDRRVIVLGDVNTFVLDEADRMLDMGFVRDIQAVAELIPRDRQTLCFSATMTPDVQKIMNGMMRDPEVVSVRQGETSDHIDQDIIEAVDKNDKIEKLIELLGRDSTEKTIVFCETKFGAQRLSDRLVAEGLPSVAIHGNKSQSQRERALRQFKTHEADIMVATDVAARGLDIPSVSHVINFDQPRAYEDYVHRIGRTGRAGQTGKALTFVESKSARPAASSDRSDSRPRRDAKSGNSTSPRRHTPTGGSTPSVTPGRRRRPPSSKVAEERLTRLIESQ